jgi:hypothetical protein
MVNRTQIVPGVNAFVAQGQSFFHNAQELEEFAGAIAKIAEGDGDFSAAVKSQETDGGVTKGS